MSAISSLVLQKEKQLLQFLLFMFHNNKLETEKWKRVNSLYRQVFFPIWKEMQLYLQYISGILMFVLFHKYKWRVNLEDILYKEGKSQKILSKRKLNCIQGWMAKCSTGFAFLIMFILLGSLSLVLVGLKVTMISNCLKTELMSQEEITNKDTGTTGSLWIASCFFFNKKCWRTKIWTTVSCGHI